MTTQLESALLFHGLHEQMMMITSRSQGKKSSNFNLNSPVIGTRSHDNTLKLSSGQFIPMCVSHQYSSVSYINEVHSLKTKCEN